LAVCLITSWLQLSMKAGLARVQFFHVQFKIDAGKFQMEQE
jgi:hypothetical protein